MWGWGRGGWDVRREASHPLGHLRTRTHPCVPAEEALARLCSGGCLDAVATCSAEQLTNDDGARQSSLQP